MTESESGKSIVDHIPTQLLDLMLDVILEVMKAERGSIMLLDDESRDLTIKSARGLRNEIIKKTRVRLGSGVSGKVAATGQPVFLKGFSGDRRLNIKPDDLINPEIRTSYVVPIKLHDGTPGTININSTQPDHGITAEKDRLVQGILYRFLEYLGQVEPPPSRYDPPSQLYMMNIFREYGTLRELRGVFDFIFHLVTDLLETRKKGVFLLKNPDSSFFDLVLGYGFDTRCYREIYEELVPILKEPRIELARHITIFTRSELLLKSEVLFEEDFYVLMPLVWKDRPQGYLLLFASEEPAFREETQTSIELICKDAARTIEEVGSGRRLQELTFTDSLTGTYNYGLWWKRLHEEVSRSQRLKNREMSLMVFDIDHFERFNLAHGHLSGDQLLRAIADQIKSCLRVNDIMGRIGGDEFGVVLPDTSKPEAVKVANRILSAVLSLPIQMRIQLAHPSTLSGGIAEFPGDAGTPDKLVERAKTALVSAKIMGGNCIKSFGRSEE